MSKKIKLIVIISVVVLVIIVFYVYNKNKVASNSNSEKLSSNSDPRNAFKEAILAAFRSTPLTQAQMQEIQRRDLERQQYAAGQYVPRKTANNTITNSPNISIG